MVSSASVIAKRPMDTEAKGIRERIQTINALCSPRPILQSQHWDAGDLPAVAKRRLRRLWEGELACPEGRWCRKG
ncbi:hypothetical protein M514_05828 [Trichuris suis]|uniref:Uncharacterized protein n=1 Tax=Trichuris suis TaxID=68888 RepID=A0A085NAE7_9BILA|nr:hypothetical protein M513_05828 [Trichuris suis]KFD66443.1 hypothetical protein M514_05828 [Trichuris suis]